MTHPAAKADMTLRAEQVEAALRRGRADLAAGPLQELTARLPQHPLVRILRRWAALLEFDWPADRVPDRAGAAPARRAAPAPDAIDLVVFHIDLPASSGATDYLAVAALSFEAAERRAPRARRILLTDERTTVPENLHAHAVVRVPIDAGRLMYERMRAQELYLAERPVGRATVFMDVDVVPNRDPAGIFAEEFDVGLTWRGDVPDAPINGGLIFVGPGAAGRDFFRETRRCYDALAADARLAPLADRDLRAWWGDQFALAAMLGYRRLGEDPPRAIRVGGVRLRLFPCADYNFTPEPGQTYAADFLAGRWFLHFKGNRKPMQAQYLAHLRAGAPG